MSRSTFLPPSSTKAQPASNVSPLHHSGSTTMRGLLPFQAEVMDEGLYRLYERLRAINPNVQQVVWALNVALNQHGWAIRTVEDLECFMDAAEAWGQEND
ncbi:hypothetical protein [Enterovibrio baiacu]|uniref:hypothetical protein n=1 Tax=Enterovibrio baiacu TaxID=2491023 RepID=UPI003D1516C6